jgi:hypothetical protein
MNLPLVRRQWMGARSAPDVPTRIAARSLSAKRTDEKQTAGPRLRPVGWRFCVAVRVRSRPRQRMCAGRNCNCCH